MSRLTVIFTYEPDYNVENIHFKNILTFKKDESKIMSKQMY